MELLFKNKVVVTDGASSGNPGPGGWAFLMDGELHKGSERQVTNNQMELYAVLKALEHCEPYTNLKIITDSKLVIGWLSKDWKCRNPLTKEILDGCKATASSKYINMTFERVKGDTHYAGFNKVDGAAYHESQALRRVLS
jgi:ribonuclease HI